MPAWRWPERAIYVPSPGKRRFPITLQARFLAMTSILDIFPEIMESILVMPGTVINRIQQLRVERGWTQQQLAEAAGVSRQSINSIERNRYVPSLQLALVFARLFACSTDEIFALEEDA